MKRSLAKTAALIMAVMMTGTAIPSTASAMSGMLDYYYETDMTMEDALAVVKSRVNIPSGLSEFYIRGCNINDTYGYKLEWHTPSKSKKYKSIEVTVLGDIIFSYKLTEKGDDDTAQSGLRFAKLTEDVLLKRAKAYIKKYNPSMDGNVKFEVSHYVPETRSAVINFKRYENGVYVRNNKGSISLDMDTGKLQSFSLSWIENAEFSDPKTAKTESDIRNMYRRRYALTPCYKLEEWKPSSTVTTYVVYSPDMTAPINAYTAQPSALPDDMEEAWGRSISDVMGQKDDGDDYYDYPDYAPVFTSWTSIIKEDEVSITREQVTEILKKDKFVALTDDYEISRYTVHSDDAPKLIIDKKAGKAYPEEGDETERFRISVEYLLKEKLRSTYNGYQKINAEIDAETGKILSMSKEDFNGERPKLDVKKADAAAYEVLKAYSGDIMNEYRADEKNNAPVRLLRTENRKNSDGEIVETEVYESVRSFKYTRYVNGIRVDGDDIYVAVDSNGVITWYHPTYTVAAFPDDIFAPEEAFDRFFEHRDMDYYYDGWVADDGSVKTYLVYKMPEFFLDARTGDLCFFNGRPFYREVSAEKGEYIDISGIPEEQAIITMKKYGVLMEDADYDGFYEEFNPSREITESDFRKLLKQVIGERLADSEIDWRSKNDDLTRERAAVIFTEYYDQDVIAKLKKNPKLPFSDVKSTDKNAGAIYAAYTLGFIGKGDGRFNGSKKLTRAEAMQMIYDYVDFVSGSAI
ncbi:MAG: S-layer homology domain-containing protein [Oscillospiraceae bacterium]|nr:S-layer homology domain-containing protein [Oscillospiraceae bacterium]